MVVYIKLGKDGKGTEFDENTINIKQTFGQYALLLNKKMEAVPLKPSGEPLEPLEPNGLYLVELPEQDNVAMFKKQWQQLQKKQQEQIKEQENLQTAPLAHDPPQNSQLEEIQKLKVLQHQEKKERK